ncbi:MAG: hypothetical protein Fur0041_03990 [Bacteroidia bacterium]
MRRFLTLLLCGASFSLLAQTSDLGMWNTFSFNKDLAKKFTFNFDQELRLRNNLSTLNLIYTNIGLTWKVNKTLRIAGVYRFIDKYKDDETWGVRHRIYTDFIFRFKPDNFTINYRARFQSEWRSWGYAAEFGNIPEMYLRNLLKVSYKINDHISPYVGMEARWQIENPRIVYHDGFDRIRFFAGVDYNINNSNTVGLYFLNQIEWNIVDPETLYIIGIEYSISL